MNILELPFEIRCQIYTYVLDWPDLNASFRIANSQCKKLASLCSSSRDPPTCSISKPWVERLTVPNIPLLNRQITAEAQKFLYQKPLVLDSPPPFSAQLGKPMDITDFISESPLQRARFVILEMDLENHDWLKTVDTLVDVWCVNNQSKSLTVRVERRARSGNSIGDYSRNTRARKTLARVCCPCSPAWRRAPADVI